MVGYHKMNRSLSRVNPRCSLPILGLFGLHDLESINDVDVGRASGTVDVAQSLHLETHRDARVPGTGSVHVEGFLKDRGWRCRRRILWRRCSENRYHEECADYREFEHLDGSFRQQGKHRIESIIPRNSSLLLLLFFVLAISTPFFLARERSNEYGDRIDTARKNHDCCLLSSSRKGPAYVFEILMAPTGWLPPAAGLQPIRAIGSPPGGRSVRVVYVSRWRASTPLVLLHRLSSSCAYLGHLCTQRVCWLPTNPPRTCA